MVLDERASEFVQIWSRRMESSFIHSVFVALAVYAERLYANAVYAITNHATSLSPLISIDNLNPPYASPTSSESSRPRSPGLKQRLPTRPALLEPLLAREHPLPPQKRLLDHALERLILIRTDLVAEQHGAGLDLSSISTLSIIIGRRKHLPRTQPPRQKQQYPHQNRRPNRPLWIRVRPAWQCSCSTSAQSPQR